MNAPGHWVTTVVVAALVGAGSAFTIVSTGAADARTERVAKPLIEKSATDTSEEFQDLLAELVELLGDRLNKVDQRQRDLENREFVLGTDLDCDWGDPVVILVPDDPYGASRSGRICVTEE